MQEAIIETHDFTVTYKVYNRDKNAKVYHFEKDFADGNNYVDFSLTITQKGYIGLRFRSVYCIGKEQIAILGKMIACADYIATSPYEWDPIYLIQKWRSN
jgi:hypothetical protein